MNKRLTTLCFAALGLVSMAHAEGTVSLTISGDAATAGITLKNSTTASTTYTINWGDATETVTIDSNPVYKSHTYAAGATRTLTITGGLDNLAYLDCSGDNVIALTVTGLSKLTTLKCSDNTISTLNISGLTSLASLDCSTNSLSTLPWAELKGLKSLDCSYNTSLNAVPLNTLTGLFDLNCNSTQVSNLSISQAPNLTKLSCENTNVSSLSLSENEKLEVLNCEDAKINSLNLTGATALTAVYCGGNKIGSLGLSGLSNLMYVDCANANVSSLSLGNTPSLLFLNASRNKVSSIDLSGATKLQTFIANNSGLTSVSTATAANTNLDRFDATNNSLASLSMRNYTKLYAVNVSNNDLASLLFYGNESAEIVNCQNNKLDFGSVPDYKDISLYNYAPQKDLSIAAPATGSDAVDLSLQNVERWGDKKASEAIYHLTSGKRAASTFAWKTANNNLVDASQCFMDENGVAHFAKGFNSEVYCEVTNPNFPGLTLKTNTIKVNQTATTYIGTISYQTDKGNSIETVKVSVAQGANYTVPTSYKGGTVTTATIGDKALVAGATYTPTADFNGTIKVTSDNITESSTTVTLGGILTSVNQLTDGMKVAIKCHKDDKCYLFEKDGKIYAANSPMPTTSAAYVFTVKKTGSTYAFMTESGKYLSSLSANQATAETTPAQYTIASPMSGYSAATNYFFMQNNNLVLNTNNSGNEGGYANGKALAGANGDYSQFGFFPATVSTVGGGQFMPAYNVNITYVVDGKTLATEKQTITMDKDFVIPENYKNIYTVNSAVILDVNYFVGEGYSPIKDFAVTLNLSSPLKPTTISNGKFADGTTWYSINMENRYWTYESGTAQVQTSSSYASTNDKQLWCVTGNAVDGYQFYNRAAGATSPIAFSTSAGATIGTTAASFVIEPSTIIGQYCFKQIGETSYISSVAGGNSGNYKLASATTISAATSAATINVVETITNTIKSMGTKIGYVGGYTLSQVTAMNEALKTYTQATTETNFSELLVVMSNQPTIAFDVNKVYRLFNYAYPTRVMINVNEKVSALPYNEAEPQEAEKWQLEANGSNYYIKNVSSGLYVGETSTSAQVGLASAKVAYVMIKNESNPMIFSFLPVSHQSGNFGLHAAASQSYMVVGWSNSQDPTWWSLQDTSEVIGTGLDAVEMQSDASIYDLTGRKVAKTSSGIYIRRGKKLFVK